MTTRPPGRSDALGAAQHGGDRVAVAGHAAPDLLRVAAVEAEQLERVRVLLVVVDEARIGRRREDEIDGPGRIDLARVALDDRDRVVGAQVAELLHPLRRVAGVAAEELPRLADGTADAPVLVAEVLAPHWLAREVQVVMTRQSRRARGTREHDAPEIRIGGVLDLRAERRQLGERLRREPALQVAGAPRSDVDPVQFFRDHDQVAEQRRPGRTPPSSRE